MSEKGGLQKVNEWKTVWRYRLDYQVTTKTNCSLVHKKFATIYWCEVTRVFFKIKKFGIEKWIWRRNSGMLLHFFGGWVNLHSRHIRRWKRFTKTIVLVGQRLISSQKIQNRLLKSHRVNDPLQLLQKCISTQSLLSFRDDRHISVRMLESMVHISKSIHRILREHLPMRRICSTWVLHFLMY